VDEFIYNNITIYCTLCPLCKLPSYLVTENTGDQQADKDHGMDTNEAIEPQNKNVPPEATEPQKENVPPVVEQQIHVQTEEVGQTGHNRQQIQKAVKGKKEKKAVEPLVLSREQLDDLATWWQNHPELYKKNLDSFKDRGLKERVVTEQAEKMGVERK